MKCQICDLEMKLIPAGVSKKTGRPYKEFWACPDKCQKPNQKVSSDQQMIIDILMAMDKKINERFDGLGKYLVEKLDKKDILKDMKF